MTLDSTNNVFTVYHKLLSQRSGHLLMDYEVADYFKMFLRHDGPPEKVIRYFSILESALKELNMSPESAKLWIILWLGAHPNV